jgi:hypothetical protein
VSAVTGRSSRLGVQKRSARVAVNLQRALAALKGNFIERQGFEGILKGDRRKEISRIYRCVD